MWLECFKKVIGDPPIRRFDCEPGALFVSWPLGESEGYFLETQNEQLTVPLYFMDRLPLTLDRLAGAMLHRASQSGQRFPTDIETSLVVGPKGLLFVGPPEYVGVYCRDLSKGLHGLALLRPSCVTLPRIRGRYEILRDEEFLV